MSVRADFYMIAGRPQFVAQPLLLVCKLAEKAVLAGQACLIFCESAEQADFLDDLLWDFDDDAFVPHQIVGDDEEDADELGLWMEELEPPQGNHDEDLLPQMIRTVGPRH